MESLIGLTSEQWCRTVNTSEIVSRFPNPRPTKALWIDENVDPNCLWREVVESSLQGISARNLTANDRLNPEYRVFMDVLREEFCKMKALWPVNFRPNIATDHLFKVAKNFHSK